ncbi:MAG TPA: glycogen/starch/alpha-glucan phosphorylase [Candidatus Thiothrix moscowensis]|uniref:glycogen/starch/alpha-glucan phosphorylase n=1 Tax=unclassified Thiothrix TaxID=2636184 RepID=UPI0025D823CF|nr:MULTISPECIES: glycogen/starch/alpha-glucan phosphorylase [unclassified Thiothrix]HRJ54478.1 glycogen/starch/alpha-glucan phosphorylase [Candidatus Thiothrix moscowensis]HRJ94821.1 glycogen/starch/alpha-glucan phosphorylase [Candidatus Thiothrix moscowensis]
MTQHLSTHIPYVSVPLDPLPNHAEALGDDFQRYLSYHLGRFQGCPSVYLYQALAYTLRDRLMVDWRNTWGEYLQPGKRRAFYMSLEFLIGRSLGNNLLNMDICESTKQALLNYCTDLEEVAAQEPDAGLGNGGLGRLAACFMDSCATLSLPVVGYGIRYEYGMFRQRVENGYQVEDPDHWLRDGNPWEVERAEYVQRVKFGGHTEHYTDDQGRLRVRWVSTDDVLAIPFDMPISGYKNNTVNTLRLWKATATDEFNLDEFNAGSYTEAVEAKNHAEHISMVLYPNDSSENGKELRLRQQYFLASASLKDAVRMWERQSSAPDYSTFAAENVFQMNDTHPTVAVACLMRILLDEKGLEWDEAWEITRNCMAYTNHTLLPEALERWPVHLFAKLLPRILEIIYEINARFLREVSMKWPGDTDRQRRMSIIEEGNVKQVRMAWLAIVGSFSVNGVAALHSDLLVEGLFRDFYELWPEKFNNKTNGVTPRRWVAHANQGMTALVSNHIGKDWIRDLSQLQQLQALAEPGNEAFQQQWQAVKYANKQRLAALVKQECGVDFNPNALFDVQVKRIHEYKRQLLNILHVIHLYRRIKLGRLDNWADRCVLIGGKAAPGYAMAKRIIKLINSVAEVVNTDPEVDGRLKVAFIPNYRVSSMEIIAPAANLSEQISTAGKEASGTGNMKFMMNGALTIGTYDGANIEILEAVGEDNFFLFGLRAEDVAELKRDYRPWTYVERDDDLRGVIEWIRSGHFNPCEPGIFDMILDAILSPHDPWMTLADFRSYVDAQEQVSLAWQDQARWTRMSIMNTACSGFFSTDRTMEEYNRDIWKLKPGGNGNGD